MWKGLQNVTPCKQQKALSATCEIQESFLFHSLVLLSTKLRHRFRSCVIHFSFHPFFLYVQFICFYPLLLLLLPFLSLHYVPKIVIFRGGNASVKINCALYICSCNFRSKNLCLLKGICMYVYIYIHTCTQANILSCELFAFAEECERTTWISPS